MDDNSTRHSQRAAAGLAKAVRQKYAPPDTQIVGPDGTVRFLGRREDCLDPVIAFHKYNPARRDARSGKRPKPGTGAARKGRCGGDAVSFGRSAPARTCGGALGELLQRPMELLNRVPFMNLLITAALAHRVWCFITRRFRGGDGSSVAAAARNGDRRLVTRPADAASGDDDDEYDDDEYELDERAEELLVQMQNASMLPTMLRASLPRPHRNSLAKRAAQQYHSRPRGYRTAHQMMHGGPTAATSGAGGGGKSAGGIAGTGSGRRQAQRRPLGKLEKMDLIVRQQVRAAMMAQQRQQEQLLLQLQQPLGALGAWPSGGGPFLALPAPAFGPQSSGSGGPSAGSHPPALSLRSPAAARASSAYPQMLELGLPPPPPFRPLPPELRARMKGLRHPGAAALSPATRAAAAGPPPLAGLREASAAVSCARGGSDAAGRSAAATAVSGSRSGLVASENGEGSGNVQVQVETVEGGGAAAGVVGFEESDAKLVVPRAIRGARIAKKVHWQGQEAAT